MWEKKQWKTLLLTYSHIILIVDRYFQTFTHSIKCVVLFCCCIVSYLCVCYSLILSLSPSTLLPHLSYEAESSLFVIIRFIVIESPYKAWWSLTAWRSDHRWCCKQTKESPNDSNLINIRCFTTLLISLFSSQFMFLTFFYVWPCKHFPV